MDDAGTRTTSSDKNRAAPEIGAAVYERSLAELAAEMAAGRLSSEKAVRAYMERIQALDQSGPGLASVIEVNPDAEQIARDLDAERRTSGPRGSLHGVPILLKDNFATADGMRTAAGSVALEDSTAPEDSGVAARLREAGAVLLGKANLSEWSNFRSPRSSSGWSSRGGQCRNPYALDRSPGGSSSGSGAATAASLCAAAIGTETDGSIVAPASYCGVVGFKPTVGLVSRAGIIPIAHSMDTAGPMARTVEDATLLLADMQGSDPRDATTTNIPEGALVDPAEVVAPGRLQGVRLAVARNLVAAHPLVAQQFEQVLGTLRDAGAVIVDDLALYRVGEWRPTEMEVLLHEFKHGLNAYLAALPDDGQPRDLAELIEFNIENAQRCMPHFGQELFEAAQAKGPITEPAYLQALAEIQRMCRQDGIDALLEQHTLNALICPTTNAAELIDHVNGEARRPGGSAASPAAVAGYPHASVPAGLVHSMPWGLSIFGTAWSDAKILRYAHAFEQATKARRAPRLLSTAELDGVAAG